MVTVQREPGRITIVIEADTVSCGEGCSVAPAMESVCEFLGSLSHRVCSEPPKQPTGSNA